jgi:cytochrome b subunit of formate dehydrogenase
MHTCGECHPGISAELAAVSIHETATGLKTGWPRFFTILYLWIICITIGVMLLHNFADWFRYVRDMRKKPYVLRLTLNETMQHWVLMISFIILVISGFSLRFSEAWWVQMLFGWGEGEGFLIRGTVHRSSGVIFFICGAWHVVYLATHRGRRTLLDIIPGKTDLINIGENVAYFLGRREKPARFKRFTYMEKAEYWALIWGSIIMTTTGLLLWFDNFFVSTLGLPKGILDVVLIIHYYEAWLATLAIVVWHGYGVLLAPHVYPMNPSWVTGRMPKDMYASEHPEGPRLKARMFRVRYVEEELEEDEEEEEELVPEPRQQSNPDREIARLREKP